ncbi:MAG: M20/M25/M40 family metallo-hydrolase [Planctomycetota bacterium]|jgi:hypothetical protein
MRANILIATCVLTLSVCFAGVTRADEVEDIINQVSLSEYESYLRVLTGVDPVPGPPLHNLQNRYSFGSDIHFAGQWIHDHFASLGLDASLHTYDPGYGPNVIGELPGTTYPDEIYVLCGHYDTYNGSDQLHAPGCDDNGSGTAAVMMAARILSTYRPESTIRFIAFSGEEQWMVGSEAYAAAAAAAGDNIVGAINLDMFLQPGFDNQSPDPDYDIDIGADSYSQWLVHLLGILFGIYTPIDYELHEDSGFVSDQWGFWQHGYHAVGLIENTPNEIWGGSNDAYHQTTDTMSNPDYDWDFALHVIRGSMAGLIDFAGVVPCPADVDGNRVVDVNDFLLILAAWGQSGVPEDLNRDGIVNIVDFLQLLSEWGGCP